MIRQITTGKSPGDAASDLRVRIWQAIDDEADEAGAQGIYFALVIGTLELVKAEVIEHALND